MFSFLQKNKGIQVIAPVNGEVKGITEVNDPVFSEKMMGDGIAVQYANGDVVAPICGVISTVIQPSCHAFGIKSDDGLELLVHVGLETVNLKGEGFQLHKQQGDRVEVGDKVLSVDAELLSSKGIDMITPIVITNSSEFKIEKSATIHEQAKAGTTVLMTCTKNK